mgnify:CR=1 FL=1
MLMTSTFSSNFIASNTDRSFLIAVTFLRSRKTKISSSSSTITELKAESEGSCSAITQPTITDLESASTFRTQQSEESEDQITAAIGAAPQKKVEIQDLRDTPCYAYIEGKCHSNTCLRSHNDKQILAYLQDKQDKLDKQGVQGERREAQAAACKRKKQMSLFQPARQS